MTALEATKTSGFCWSDFRVSHEALLRQKIVCLEISIEVPLVGPLVSARAACAVGLVQM